jgi:hypothetical protein
MRLLNLCFLSLLAIPLQAQTLSGPINNPANGHDYYLSVPDTSTAAESLAISMGDHLTTINSADEDSWVLSTFGLFGGQQRNLWIGLRVFQTEW